MTKPYSKSQQLNHNKKPRRKRCKECNKLFVPQREMQPCCSYECEMKYISKPDNLKKHVEHGKKLRDRENIKKQRESKKNDKSFQLKEVQKVVNEYVRLRDKYKPCVSCGVIHAKFDAGHFFSQGGNSSIRFNTLNIHKQCFRCNRMLSGNLDEYKPVLLIKIGKENFESLEARRNDLAKYDIDYLHRMKKVFKKKIKLYERKFR